MDNARHPALLLVDTISSLGSIDYRHDEWKVDVIVAGSQKGLMLPPGLSFNAVSDKAIAASGQAKLPRSFWAWDEIIEANKNGFWPYTPATNLLYGLSESCDMLFEEGFNNVFYRHQRHAEATRQAVRAWGLEILCQNPAEYSPALTAVVMPKDAAGQPHDADNLRKVILSNFNMSLGQGLTKLSGSVFRIGHLGDFNDLTLLAALTGVEMGLSVAGIPLPGRRRRCRDEVSGAAPAGQFRPISRSSAASRQLAPAPGTSLQPCSICIDVLRPAGDKPAKW